jgi:CHAT domain-containing protein
LNSTIVAYWVGEDSTFIWTVSPTGQVTVAQDNIGEAALNILIDEALQPSQQVASRGSRNIELPSRAGDTILISANNQAAWKRLYNALIRPIRANLPAKGARLTIIPSGPLFRLSFAALMDEKGRYLIEDYSIHYAPGAGVLSYTLQTKNHVKELPNHYVFISNPSGMPAMKNGKPLPALPGSDEEVRRISRLFAADNVSTLRGAAADEMSVRKAVESAKVIHFATHGIVSNDDPFSSYLALGRGRDGSTDGRLTAEEVYRLNLNADLVVLSACRTGLGRISGDGVAGLARAFFYAGAASVVATLWDVADAPASQLVAGFYQQMAPTLTNDKSEALRTAQLHLLRSLRRGELHVDTPFGKLPLPEDPLLWAGFVLIGEP